MMTVDYIFPSAVYLMSDELCDVFGVAHGKGIRAAKAFAYFRNRKKTAPNLSDDILYNGLIAKPLEVERIKMFIENKKPINQAISYNGLPFHIESEPVMPNDTHAVLGFTLHSKIAYPLEWLEYMKGVVDDLNRVGFVMMDIESPSADMIETLLQAGFEEDEEFDDFGRVFHYPPQA